MFHFCKAEVDRIRQHLSVMLAGFDATDGEPPWAKKARTVLPDSDCKAESDDDGSNTKLSYVDKYFTTSYDCDNIKPIQVWKCQNTKLPGLYAIARSIFASQAVTIQTWSLRRWGTSDTEVWSALKLRSDCMPMKCYVKVRRITQWV